MEQFIGQALKWMDANAGQLGDAFGKTLSHHDELMLTKIDQEMAICVERILDLALEGANAQGEIGMSKQQRDRVMELTAIRRAIHTLIEERGTLQKFREALN
jgi:hypothetical protein